MKSIFPLLLIFLMLTGCDTTDEGILCATGPVGFTFKLVDEATGENLFVNGQYEENQIQIKNSDGQTVDSSFQTERNVVVVILGWETKSDIYTVIIGEEIEFDIVFTLKESSSGGCTSTRLTELEIVGATYETSETSDITTIFVNSEEN